MVAALSGVGTTLLLYFLGKEIQDKRAGLLASFLFAIYPLAIVYNRWSFPYVVGMFWITLTFHFCFKYLKGKQSKYIYLAGCTTALAVLTIYFALELFIFLMVFMLLLKVGRKKIMLNAGIVLIPLILLFLFVLIKDKSSVLFDLHTLFQRGMQELAQKQSTWSLLADYKKLLTLDYFMFFGIIGLFFVKREYRPYLWLGFFCLSLLPVARQGRYLDISFYPLVICLPFVMLGLSSFILFILDKCRVGITAGIAKLPAISTTTQRFIQSIPLVLLLILLTPTIWKDFREVQTILVAKMNFFANRKAEDTIATAKYLNENSSAEDLIIAPLSIQQFLQSKCVDLYQAAAYSGFPSQYYPPQMPLSRFLYPCSYYWAKYVVVSEVDRFDTIQKPGAKELWQKIKHDEWLLVYQQGEFDVYLNPVYKDLGWFVKQNSESLPPKPKK